MGVRLSLLLDFSFVCIPVGLCEFVYMSCMNLCVYVVSYEFVCMCSVGPCVCVALCKEAYSFIAYYVGYVQLYNVYVYCI